VLSNGTMTRQLRWDACFNVRDLGGCATVDGAVTKFGVIVRSDSLCRLTARGCAALEAYGIRTIIDLRVAAEVRDDPTPYTRHDSVIAHHLPLNPSEPSVRKAIAAYEEMGLPYMAAVHAAFLVANQLQIAAIIQTAADASEGGVLVHCAAGRDRTGLIVALLLGIAGVSAPTIVADYILSFSTTAEAMETTLSYLESAYGGVEAYLRAAGVTKHGIARLRSRLREGEMSTCAMNDE
jgi:protein-tyrosine phosphatase